MCAICFVYGINCLLLNNCSFIGLSLALIYIFNTYILAEIGTRAEVAQCFGLKPCWEGRVSTVQRLHDGREEEPAPESSLTSREAILGDRSGIIPGVSLFSG